MKKRNIIIGIDGIPYKLINDLTSKRVMPNFFELKKQFCLKLMKSSIPHISSVSWSSIITGKNPGEHGIFGFTDIIQGTYSISFPNFNALRTKPFWHQRSNETHIILNVPATYPAQPLNGIHVAGFVALDLEKAVYPNSIIPELKSMNYEIDVDSSLAHQQSKEMFFNELFRILEIRKKVIFNFWDKMNWDNFIAVITGTDRLGHFLWHAYENKKDPNHHGFLEYFKKIDEIIGEVMKRLKEEDTLIILSDHGMEQILKNVNLNTYLEREGLLKLSDKFKRYNRVEKGSKAFVLDPGRIYLNKKGKFPKGSISAEKERETIEEIKNILLDLKFDNKKVIKKVYEKNEIYHGKMVNFAPDLIAIENEGFNLKASIGKENIFEDETIFSGKHDENCFIFANKDIDIKSPRVEDVLDIIW